MRAFRYLEPDHAQQWLEDGRIRVGTTTSVARLESGLRDAGDAAASFLQPHFAGRVVPGSAEDQMLKSFGYNLGGANVVMQNCGGSQQVYGFILCLSFDRENAHIRKTCPSASTVLEIPDVDALGRAVNDLLIPHGIVAGGRWGRVDYAPRHATGFRAGFGADPFIKEERFRPEQELRLFWPTRERVEPVFIKSAEIAAAARLAE